MEAGINSYPRPGFGAVTNASEAALIMARALLIAQETIKAQSERLHKMESARGAYIPEEYREPMPAYNTYSLTKAARRLGFPSRNDLTSFLEQEGILYRHGCRWYPRKGIDGAGYFIDKSWRHVNPDNTISTKYYTAVTEAGIAFITDLINDL